ncbi:MAG: WecB/TagA/CpsF family glycosyltransferase [Rhodospirillales bacterium]|nr:WecB/TagA/CpsF family glycosyltransferase [Rhodospirillales bacterium]
MLSEQAFAAPDSRDPIEIMGLRLHNLHRDVIAQQVANAALAQRKLLVVNANAHLIVQAQKQPWIANLFFEAGIAFCDGAGVQLAIRLLKGRAAHRTTPPEWIGNTLNIVGEHASVFWVGGAPEVVEEAAKRFEARFGVRTAGVHHGFFNISAGSPESEALLARIRDAKPNILLVNMGMPRQERWLYENWPMLPSCVAITGGALVDHAAGRVHRPPRWVANLGVEWLVRLSREPRRLWRRYVFGLPVFGFYMLRYALRGNGRTTQLSSYGQ